MQFNTYALSSFTDNEQLMRQAGILKRTIAGIVCAGIGRLGFETPSLQDAGSFGKSRYSEHCHGFKASHSIRLLKFLGEIDGNA